MRSSHAITISTSSLPSRIVEPRRDAGHQGSSPVRTGVDMADEDLARQVDQPSNDVVASRQIDCCDVTSMGTDLDQLGRFADAVPR